LYAPIIANLYGDLEERPFRFLTVVTDSISINSSWFRAPSDAWIVPNRVTAAVLQAAGIPENRIHPLGFPVSPRFTNSGEGLFQPPACEAPRRVLCLINTGKKKNARLIRRLLELPNLSLTIVVGRNKELQQSLLRKTRVAGDRVRVIGWTDQIPELMLSHHLVITKAGGAAVQEAIAARCPLIISEVIPGQEQGNAELVRQSGIGVVATRKRDLVEHVKLAFANDGFLWHQWRKRLSEISRPDAALRIARLILHECGRPVHTPLCPARWRRRAERSPRSGAVARRPHRSLLCDFHIHSQYSDGKLAVPELVDFYGQRGFDCICITDHLADPRRLVGKLARATRLVLDEDDYVEYFLTIQREARRAWRSYQMLVLPGIEFNKDGLTRKSSAHLLGIGLAQPIPADLDLLDTIAAIREQDGLAVASHPHLMKSEWGKNTLYLWEHQERFVPLLDAWEIANRNNLFAPVGLRRLPYLGNSDFHKPKHIYSWKTVLQCEKDPLAIKDCIRRNEHVSITLYREDRAFGAPAVEATERVDRLTGAGLEVLTSRRTVDVVDGRP
jgi:hypothetical protein